MKERERRTEKIANSHLLYTLHETIIFPTLINIVTEEREAFCCHPLDADDFSPSSKPQASYKLLGKFCCIIKFCAFCLSDNEEVVSWKISPSRCITLRCDSLPGSMSHHLQCEEFSN